MDGSEVIELGYRVSGRVQGVGFRWWTRRTAVEMGLDGWVRNEVDGSVVVHARGPAASVQAFERALAAGPMGARVDRVESIGPEGGIREGDFRIET